MRRVVYRLARAGEAEGRHVRQMSGPGHFGVVTLRLEPLASALPRIVVASALAPHDPVAQYLDAIAEGVVDA